MRKPTIERHSTMGDIVLTALIIATLSGCGTITPVEEFRQKFSGEAIYTKKGQ